LTEPTAPTWLRLRRRRGENVVLFKKLSVPRANRQGFGTRKGAFSSTQSREENRPLSLVVSELAPQE
jgi:hypothetical protein